jgi:hypothetical protein
VGAALGPLLGSARRWGEVVGEEPVINLDVFTPRRAEYA